MWLEEFGQPNSSQMSTMYMLHRTISLPRLVKTKGFEPLTSISDVLDVLLIRLRKQTGVIYIDVDLHAR